MDEKHAQCKCGSCGIPFSVELPILLNSPKNIIRCVKCNSELVSVIPKDVGSLAEVPEYYKRLRGVDLLDYFERLIQSGVSKEQHERRDTRKEILGRLGILE